MFTPVQRRHLHIIPLIIQLLNSTFPGCWTSEEKQDSKQVNYPSMTLNFSWIIASGTRAGNVWPHHCRTHCGTQRKVHWHYGGFRQSRKWAGRKTQPSSPLPATNSHLLRWLSCVCPYTLPVEPVPSVDKILITRQLSHTLCPSTIDASPGLVQHCVIYTRVSEC